jgi:hypothetical protein
MSNQPRCYLLELPTELRLEIYSHIFTLTHSVILAVVDSVYVKFNGITPGRYKPRWIYGNLLQTCRTIYREAAPALYGQAHFTIDIEDGVIQRIEENDTPAKHISETVSACRTLPVIRHAMLTLNVRHTRAMMTG